MSWRSPSGSAAKTARIRRGSLSSAPIQICTKTSSFAQTIMSVFVPPTTRGRADVERELHAVRQRRVRIGDEHVGEREVDRRGLERGNQRRLDRRWRIGDRGQVLRRRVGDHRLAVVVELGRRPVAGHQDPELVRPLHRHVVARRVDDRRPELARILVADGRRERHRLRRGEPGADGFQQVHRPRLDDQLESAGRRLLAPAWRPSQRVPSLPAPHRRRWRGLRTDRRRHRESRQERERPFEVRGNLHRRLHVPQRARQDIRGSSRIRTSC